VAGDVLIEQLPGVFRLVSYDGATKAGAEAVRQH
jgi:hypothetical protein